jgi:hypothetical protein
MTWRGIPILNKFESRIPAVPRFCESPEIFRSQITGTLAFVGISELGGQNMPNALISLLSLIPFGSPMGTILFTFSTVSLILAWRAKRLKLNGSGFELTFGK